MRYELGYHITYINIVLSASELEALINVLPDQLSSEMNEIRLSMNRALSTVKENHKCSLTSSELPE